MLLEQTRKSLFLFPLQEKGYVSREKRKNCHASKRFLRVYYEITYLESAK